MFAPLLSPGGGGSAAPAELPAWKQALIFALSLVAFVLLDGAWIGLVAADFYQSRLQPILKPTDVVAALLSWACIVAMNQVFVLPQNTRPGTSAFACLANGSVLGLLLYGTVDFTNVALVREWSWVVGAVDIAWGTTACAVTAVVQVSLHTWLARGGGDGGDAERSA